jgi:hypothetical protein
MFWVRHRRERDFEGIFRPQGIWREILGRWPQYLGSDLREDSEVERRFRLFDYWESHSSFEEFCRSHQSEIDRLDRLIADEGIVDRKELLGMFYMDGPDDQDEEGQNLVPS